MKWNYFKFTWQLYYKYFICFCLLPLTVHFWPTNEYSELKGHFLILFLVMALIKSSHFDLMSMIQSPGKAMSMKYLLSLNMGKKEFFINHLASKYLLALPSLFTAMLVHLEMVSDAKNAPSAWITFFAGSIVVLFMGCSSFYQRYFVHKSGTFQEQYIKGQYLYKWRLFLTVFFSLFIITLTLDYYSIKIFNIEATVIMMVIFAFPFYILATWYLFFPIAIIGVVYKYFKTLSEILNPSFFEKPFKKPAREKAFMFGLIAGVLCCIFSIDDSDHMYRGNKLTEAIHHKKWDQIQKYATNDYINAPARSGLTPLAAAVVTGHWETYQFLKNKGAQSTRSISINQKKYSLIELAISGKNSKILEDLLATGLYDVNEKMNSGNTFLHLASSRCLSESAMTLIKNGAEINAQNPQGQTPLHLTIKNGCSDTGLVLLDHGADPTIKDKENRIALDLKNKEILPYLENQLRKPASIEESERETKGHN